MSSMSLLAPSNVLPAAAGALAAFLLSTSFPGFDSPEPAARRQGSSLLMTEYRACQARGDRSREQCVGEAQGKALIRRAEWLARIEPQARTTRYDQADASPADATEAAKRRWAGTP